MCTFYNISNIQHIYKLNPFIINYLLINIFYVTLLANYLGTYSYISYYLDCPKFKDSSYSVRQRLRVPFPRSLGENTARTISVSKKHRPRLNSSLCFKRTVTQIGTSWLGAPLCTFVTLIPLFITLGLKTECFTNMCSDVNL